MQLLLRLTVLLIACLLAFSFAPSSVAASAPPAAPETHVVQSGDTLFSIALHYNTTVAALKKANGLTGDVILVGQKLQIPSNDTSSASPPPAVKGSSYIVQPGDTLYRIAVKFGVSARALADLNGIPNPNLIAPGQALAIPNDLSPAKPGLSIDPRTARQGGTLELQISRLNVANVSGTLDGKPIRFVRNAGYYYALIGISRCAKLGEAPLNVTLTDSSGQTSTESASITIAATAFPIEKIVLPPGKGALLEPTLLAREAEQLAKVVSSYTSTRLWTGAFRPPVSGEITSYFGTRRSYNSGPVGACGHEGTDFRVSMGDPVYASARGRVAFAALTQVRGNMVVLDHGLGVYSGFYHMSQLLVQPGQTVQAGSLVGRAGSTGLSTGPHMHWSMWVNGEYVDPMEWTRRVLP